MKRRRINYGSSVAKRAGGFPTGIRSQAEVARLLGISQNRVSQLERQALAKLAAYFKKGTE